VRPTDLAGADPAGAAAEDAGLARVVVGRGERRPPEQPVAFLERAGQGVGCTRPCCISTPL
jgi:hypothetical protein